MNLRGESLSFKTLAHNISDAVVMTDADGSIAWTNPAFRKLCGYSHKEILGRKLGQLLQGKIPIQPPLKHCTMRSITANASSLKF